MSQLLYTDLTPFYRLVDPPEDHLGEATSYRDALLRAATEPRTLLDLGAGAGHNALHLKSRFACTLADLSEPMLALSREINPECEHVQGDMRSLRLQREFDTVLVHDAIMYMTTEADLRAAVQTAFVHTKQGGAVVFAPDTFRDTYRESHDLLEGDDGVRSMRGVEWDWDPDPSDTTTMVEYSFLLRDGGSMFAVHDRHVEGLFSLETWRNLLVETGFRVDMFQRPLDDENEFDSVFVCQK